MNMFTKFFAWIFRILQNAHEESKMNELRKRYPGTKLSKGYIEGDVRIGKNTYINARYRIVSGENSLVEIGEHCAIGRNFSCSSRTHSLTRPTSDDVHVTHLTEESSISIGNYVWIGDNVVIKHGTRISDYSVIGANSVVALNTEPFEVIAGNPAKRIRINSLHYSYGDGVR